ncbi:L,D-transpeptidase family protein [Aquabacter spiritensis]|uniref:Murein L,D-transpeptidase YafK n=1 Tax=Aquabacter spiritensis TaxID=933073 RepID=A0A4V6NZM3_9HYPH|nr:murein L,D-transpeptidase family protein [Aquabacter spiritensis]TCT07978.1 murein L,D-transpeptidase YafK [Aquabacter spiritensis]
MSRPQPLLSRVRLAALAACAALALAGCNGDSYDISARARQPLSAKTLALIDEKGMTPESPILVRIYKQESELEVWKQKRDGDFALLKTYPICRWSGDLGPKVRVGDRQAPEGFYTITPGQMNPNSSYYLAFNLGFPNAYDRAYGRTGDFLMVHGDCSSAGCYAMTDEQVSEIFALARDSFAGGQKAFQVQALPFRMTPVNLAKHRNNPNMPFWKNLKEGVDTFEVTKREPKVNVCNRRYLFNATAEGPRGFDASAPCPSYTVPVDVAEAVSAKARADETKVAELVSSTPSAPNRAGIDGGMHPVFLAKFKELNPSHNDGQIVVAGPVPGTMPAKTTNPPRVADDGFSPIGTPTGSLLAAAQPAIFTARPGAPASPDAAPAPAAPDAATRVASTDPEGLSFAKMLGFNPAATPAAEPLTPAVAPAAPPPRPTLAAPAPVRPAASPVPASRAATAPSSVPAAATAGAPEQQTASLSREPGFAPPPAPLAGSTTIVGTTGFTTAR